MPIETNYKNTSYCSAVVKEIQQNGKSFDSFMSSGDFKDFDKYFNFGNKFSASTYPPIGQTTRTATIVKPTKPWKQTYNSANRPRKQLDRNPENSEKQEEKQHHKNIKFVQTKSDDSQRFLTEVEKNKPKEEEMRGEKDEGAGNVWAGEGFDDFSTFLDKSELSVSDWYPWENKDQKKNKMEPIEIIHEKQRKTKPTKNTLKPSNPPKTLNLNSLDKARVYQICKNTKSRDVTNLCKEYSLNNTREVMRKAVKQRKPGMKEKKRLRKRKKAKRPEKKIDKSKPRKHLFFESGLSFRRRKSERSRSLLEKLTSEMTRLLWPARSARRYEEKSYQPVKQKGSSKPRRDWLLEAAKTYSQDWHQY